jgi:hypothetical protein
MRYRAASSVPGRNLPSSSELELLKCSCDEGVDAGFWMVRVAPPSAFDGSPQ